jgi:hypothetical protein
MISSAIEITVLIAIAVLAFKFLTLYADRKEADRATKARKARKERNEARQAKSDTYRNNFKYASAANTAAQNFRPVC